MKKDEVITFVLLPTFLILWTAILDAYIIRHAGNGFTFGAGAFTAMIVLLSSTLYWLGLIKQKDYFMTEINLHIVEFDYAGFGSHPRLTCITCEGKTLLKKPYMTLQDWQKLVAEFAEAHPSAQAAHYNKMINGESNG